jgi:hypothetical protein
VLYFGVWVQIPCRSVPDRRRSNHPFGACEVAFRGSLVRWLGSRGPDHGQAEVYLDGSLVDTVDAYAPQAQASQVLFETQGLEDGRIHTLRIVVRRERHPEATDCLQGIDSFEVESVADYPRELRAMAMDELKTIAVGGKPYLTPDQWEPVAYAAEAPETGVQLHPGVLRDAFERNIRYILDTAANPCTGFWVEGLPASSEGRVLGAAAHSLRWEEREDLRAIVDEIVETVKQRQDEDGYCLPYDRSYMVAQMHGFDDERRNYDRVNLTRGMVAAGRVGNADALPVMRRFYDWLNASGIYASLLAGPRDGSGSNCNNGHEGGLLMYFSPVGKPEDVVALKRYFVQDFFIEQMRRAEPLALCYYPLHTPHSYVLLAFKAWLDHYRATGAAKYLDAALGAWEVVHRYYEHVGGSIAICEEPKGAYPPQSYLLTRHTGETCGSVFWADINHRLLQFFPDRESYAAEIEKSIFNVILAAQDANGHIRYHNHVHRKKDPPTRVNTCCEVMGAPFIARLPQFVYSIDDEGLWINLFAASRVAWTHDGKDVALDMATEFPYDGAVASSIATPTETTMSIRVRIPSWVAEPVTVTVNGEPAATGTPGSYVHLARTWQDGDSLRLVLPMDFRVTPYTGLDHSPSQWWEPASVVPKHRYALSYGPLLMALAGTKSLDLSPDELAQALSPIEGSPLHFAVRGRDDCHFEPYWALGEGEMTCFPALR